MTKQELRRLLKERRAAISPEEQKEAARTIVSRIAASKEFQRASAILLYAPMPGELDLLPLASIARKARKPVAFPRCDPETGRLRFFLWEPDARLQPGAYGIPEPPLHAKEYRPDARTLCILPGLSFSPTGERLGYGKGYYDRFLATFPGLAVGAAYEKLVLRELPTEPHDRPVTVLFTERARIDCAAWAKRNGQATGKAKPSALQTRITSLILAGKRRLFGTAEKALTVGEQTRSIRPLHAPPILVGAIFVLLLLSRLISPLWTDRRIGFLLLLLLQAVIFALPAALYLHRRGKPFLAHLRLRPPRPDHIRFLLCMPVVMICGGMLCEILTGGIASLEGSFTIYDSFSARIMSLPDAILAILAYAFLPAILEELVFRAILCAEYERYGAPVAIGVSALFFAMLHFSLPLFPAYLLLGMFLACATYVTRSYVAAVLLHLCYNLFCLFGQPFLSTFYVRAGSNEIFIFCLTVLFLLFGAFAAGEARKIYHRYARENLDSSHTPALPPREIPVALLRSLLSPAVAVCTLVWLITAVLNLLGV